jgi:hypothetical protein
MLSAPEFNQFSCTHESPSRNRAQDLVPLVVGIIIFIYRLAIDGLWGTISVL